MLAGGYSWRLFQYVLIAFAVALFIAAFLFVEESAYKRYARPATADSDGEKTSADKVEVIPMVPPRKSFLATLKVWSGIDHEAEFFMTMARSFTYFLIPSVLWVITSYGMSFALAAALDLTWLGIFIGLGALTFNYTFPIKIVAPPYNWSQVR